MAYAILLCAVASLSTGAGGIIVALWPKMSSRILADFQGFAAGVMIAASVLSLLIPSIDMAVEQGEIGWMPALVGFLLGIVFLLSLDTIIPNYHINSDNPEG